MSSLRRLLRTYPGTLLLAAAFVSLGTLTFTVLRDQHPAMRAYVGWDLDTLEAGRYWRQMPGTLLQGAPGFKWHQPVLILLFVGWLEYAVRGWRAVTTYFLCDWISAPLATACVWACASLGVRSAQPLLHLPSSGSSAAAIACGAAAATLLPGRWGIVGAGTFMGIVVHSFTYQKLDASFAHLFASLVAIGLSTTFWRHCQDRRYPPRPWSRRRSDATVAGT